MHHQVLIRHHEWIRECIRHCWPVDAGHDFPKHLIIPTGSDLMAKHKSVRRRMPPFASLNSSLFLGFLSSPVKYRFCISSYSTSKVLSPVQITCTNRSPYRQGLSILHQPMKHGQFPMLQEYQRQIAFNPECSYAPTEHVRRPHFEQFSGVHQIQSQQEVDGHTQKLLQERFNDGVSCVEHLFQVLLFPAWTQEFQDFVVPPGLQLALRLIRPEKKPPTVT